MGLLCELASTKSGEALHNQQFMGTKTAAFMPFLRASRITTALEWLRAVLIKGWWLGVGVGVGGVWVGEGGGRLVLRRFTCWCWWEVRWWRGWRWHSVVAVGEGLLLDRIHLGSGLSCGRALPAKLLVCKSDCLSVGFTGAPLSMVWCQNLHSSAFSTKREKQECIGINKIQN